MINFFAVLLIIFIGLFLLFFKRTKIENAFNIKKLNSKKLTTNKENNIKLQSKKHYYSQIEERNYSKLYRQSLRKKMFQLFESHSEDKLKALKIAEALADKTTLPILRRGLKDTSPEVVEKSAYLIRNFK